MPLFNKLVDSPQAGKSLDIGCPIKGQVFNLSELPHPVFQQRLLGEGVAISPRGFQFFSPFDAVVSDFPNHCEYLRLTSHKGLKLHIQLAFSPGKLMGQGVQTKVQSGQRVKQNELLFILDLNKLKRILGQSHLAICLLNSDKIPAIYPHYGTVEVTEPLLTLYTRINAAKADFNS